MKHLFLASLLALAGCSATDTSSNTATENSSATNCPELSERIPASAGTQVRVYYKAPGFNPKSKDCWAILRSKAKEEAGVGADKKIIAFIDAPTFTPGKDGMYDNNEQVQRRIIAQVLVNEDAGIFNFTPDPLGYGKYTEPK